MKKKIIAICLCVALVAVGIVGATLAYFTDNKKLENTFTVGNVSIDLWEYAGEGEFSEEKIGEYHKFTSWGKYSDIMPGDQMVKAPVVKNTGAYDAYVRVTVVMNNLVAINDAIDEVYENLDTPKNEAEIQAIYDEVFDGWGLSYLKNDAEPRRLWMDENDHPGTEKVQVFGIDMWSRNDETYGQFSETNLFKSESEQNSYGDGIVYLSDGDKSYYGDAAQVDERVFVFYLKMAPGETFQLFNGLNVPTDFTAEQMKMFQNLKINIYADAIQTANFDNYVDAFNALEAAHPLGSWK